MEIEIKQNDGSLTLDIPSSLDEISAALDIAKNFFKQFEVNEIQATKNTVVLRELLANAIVHGHYCNDRMSVFVKIEHLKKKQFKILVKDGGNGFDYSDLHLLIAENTDDIQRHGFVLVNVLTEHYEFNGKGNCITVITQRYEE